MDKRIGTIAIIIEKMESAAKVNELLHEYGNLFIGRMGIPYRERGVHVITLITDCPVDELSAITGKIGKLEGVIVKSMMQKNTK